MPNKHIKYTPFGRRTLASSRRLCGRYAALGIALAFLTINASAEEASQVNDPSKTTYGEIAPNAPNELRAFSFLVGKWEGKGKTRLENGTFAEYPVTWIGRYILNGTAIADEVRAPAPDGSPWLGISLRQYDRASKTWIIEFLNVTGSFIRKQVNPVSGSVAVTGQDVVVASESPGMKIREHYLVPDHTHFTYRLDVSRDGGKVWSEGQIEMTFLRQE